MSRVFCRGVIREHIAGKQQHTNRALEVCTAKILADEKSLCRNQFEILMMSSLFPPLLKPTQAMSRQPASWSAVTAAQTLRIRKGARESLFCSGAPCKSSTTIFERFCEGLQSVTVYFDIVSRNIRWAIV